MITVTQKVFFTRGTHGRRRIVDKPPPTQTVPEGRVPRLAKLMALALDIQEEILFLPKVLVGRDPIHEKQLRRICQEPSFARQRRMWQVLKRSRMEEPAA